MPSRLSATGADVGRRPIAAPVRNLGKPIANRRGRVSGLLGQVKRIGGARGRLFYNSQALAKGLQFRQTPPFRQQGRQTQPRGYFDFRIRFAQLLRSAYTVGARRPVVRGPTVIAPQGASALARVYRRFRQRWLGSEKFGFGANMMHHGNGFLRAKPSILACCLGVFRRFLRRIQVVHSQKRLSLIETLLRGCNQRGKIRGGGKRD